MKSPSAKGPLECNADEGNGRIDAVHDTRLCGAVVDAPCEEAHDNAIALLPRRGGHDDRRIRVSHGNSVAVDLNSDVTVASRNPTTGVEDSMGVEPTPTWSMRLLGRFELCRDGREIVLPPQGRRVLAFLALNGPAAPRRTIAERLWPLRPADRAQSALRSAFWHIEHHAPCAVLATRTMLALASELRIDISDLVHSPVGADTKMRLSDWRSDLLPDMDEDWLVFERELLRQRRIHALEALSAEHRGARRFGEAIEAAMAAVEAEPLRESSRLALIEAHFGEGNTSEALRQFEDYGALLQRELGIGVSSTLRAIIADARRVTADDARPSHRR